MVGAIILSSMLASLVTTLTNLNDRLLLGINGLAGRSWLFDSTVAFFRDNDLAKAGVIGCCFLAAWYGGKTTSGTTTRRKFLIVGLIAAVCVIATTKVLSHTIFLPRPEIQSRKIYRLEGDQLVEMKRMPVRVPLDETSQKDYRALVNGDVETNDALRKRFGGWLDKLAGLTLSYSALSSAFVFAVAFEVSSTMVHVRAFLGLLAAMRRHVLLGMS